MSVASKLLGTPSHEEMAAVREQAQVRASEDAKTIRDLEKQLREKDGESQDRGRALADARKRILELAEKATAIETGLRQRDWQMEQQRERARQAMGLLKDITAPVQTEAGAVASPPGRMGAVSSRETEAGALASLRAGMGRQP
jgi:chromosome segregation ATPase